MFSSKNLPIMPTLCSKLAYYAGIMLDALACLLCLKLCRHNRRMPNPCMHAIIVIYGDIFKIPVQILPQGVKLKQLRTLRRKYKLHPSQNIFLLTLTHLRLLFKK